MEVVILGSGSPLPDPNRAGPSTLVRTAIGDLLFDCGRGVLMRAAAAQSGAGAFTGLFITHLHSDHITDFNDVYTSRWVMSFAPNPLAVYGPVGTARLVALTEEMLEPDIGYRLEHHEDLTWRPSATVVEIESGVALDTEAVQVLAQPTAHAPVHPTVGFRVQEGDSSVVIAGDTIPCEGLDTLCAGADVLVHTVLRRDLIEAIGIPRLLDTIDYHSDVADAARTATRGGVKKLVLTHLVPAPAPEAEHEWLEQAAAHFDGEIVIARDLTAVAV